MTTTSPSPSVDPVRDRIELLDAYRYTASQLVADEGDTARSWAALVEVLVALEPFADALTAALDLHHPQTISVGGYSLPLGTKRTVCSECTFKDWPCRTVSAIAAGLGVTP